MKRITTSLAAVLLLISTTAYAGPADQTPAPAAETTPSAEPAPAVQAAPADVPPSAGTAPAGSQVSVDAVVDPGQIIIGRQFNIAFDLHYPMGTRVYFPKSPDTKPLIAVRMSSDSKTVLGRDTGERHTISFLAVKAGELVLKPFEVPVVLPDGQAAVVQTPEVRVNVTSTIGNEEAPALAGPGTSSPVIVRNDILIWGLAAAGVAILAALIAIFAYRRWRAWVEAHKPPPPPVPAHEHAYSRITGIEMMGLVEKRDFKTLALMISEVIREFMGAKIGFSGTDSTTWETLELVRNRRPEQTIGKLDFLELEDFLSLCDLIKFAKFEPSANDALSLLRRARGIVDAVMYMETVAAEPVEGAATETEEPAESGEEAGKGGDR